MLCFGMTVAIILARNARGVHVLTATYLSGAHTVSSNLGAGRDYGRRRNRCGQPWSRWLPVAYLMFWVTSSEHTYNKISIMWLSIVCIT